MGWISLWHGCLHWGGVGAALLLPELNIGIGRHSGGLGRGGDRLGVGGVERREMPKNFDTVSF